MRRRVIVTHRGGWVDPAAVFSAICRGSEAAFWLDSGITAHTGVSYLGVAQRTATASVADGVVTESGQVHEGTIFDFLQVEQQRSAEVRAAVGPFALGWVGWLGYELHQQTMNTATARQSRYPDAGLLFADRVFAFDHESRTVSLLALSGNKDSGNNDSGDQINIEEVSEWTVNARAVLDACSEDHATPQRHGPAPSVEWTCSDTDYLRKIAACQRSISEGDAYQLCLTMQAQVNATPDPVDSYLALRQLSPTHHGGFVRIGDVALLSASPEQFLTITAHGEIESKPIKGTRARGATMAKDEALLNELVHSEKERAENLMIVDLMRNDIGRVSETGSVTVPELLAVESYAQVHQLVSTVRGVLRHGLSAVDAVQACFPAGSMTGAPKLSAVRLLDALEEAPRGIYSGAFGYFGLDGRVELAMVIRSIILDSAGATVGTGGGITALSVPEEELAEAKLKAAALLAVLGLVTL